MKKIPEVRLVFFLILIQLLISPVYASAAQITGSGCSVSNVGYLTELAKEYEKQTGIKILVRGGGTVVGVEDLRTGRVDFAASCRSREAGDPEDIEFIQVAWDALVFIVHKSNPVDNLSLDDVRAIYFGKTTNWKALKGSDMPIKVFVSRSKRGLSGVEASTKKLVLGGNDPAETKNTVILASTGIVEQMIDETPEGFAATGYSSGRKRDVKMLKLDGVSPTKSSIMSGRYPLKRPLFLLVSKKPRPEVKKFLDFVLSRKGQKLISSFGVVSLMDTK